MAISRATIEQMIKACIDAELAVLSGKTVQFNGRTLAMEGLGEIRKARQEWERRLITIGPNRSPTYRTARFV